MFGACGAFTRVMQSRRECCEDLAAALSNIYLIAFLAMAAFVEPATLVCRVAGTCHIESLDDSAWYSPIDRPCGSVLRNDGSVLSIDACGCHSGPSDDSDWYWLSVSPCGSSMRNSDGALLTTGLSSWKYA